METALVHCCTQAHKHSSRPPSSPEARHSERSTAAAAYVLSAVCVFDSVVLLTAVKGWVCTTEPYELMCSDYASAANNDSSNLRGVYLGASLLSAFPLPQLVWFITRMTELLFLNAATKTSNTSDHKPRHDLSECESGAFLCLFIARISENFPEDRSLICSLHTWDFHLATKTCTHSLLKGKFPYMHTHSL